MFCKIHQVVKPRPLNPPDRPGASLGREDHQRQRCKANPDPGAPQGMKAKAFPRSIPPGYCQPMRCQQQQAIEVRVDRENTGKNISHAVPARRIPQDCDEESARDRSQQHKQRVAACLLRVTNVIGVETHQRDRKQSHAPVKQLAGKPENGRQSCERNDHRQAANKKWTGAKSNHPRSSR